MDKKKKIIGGILLAIILIGIIVIILKGFNVGLSLRAHDTFKFVFEQKYELKDIKNVCEEVFKEKDYRIRGVEIFDDAVYIEAISITEDEQKALSEKLENLYKQEQIIIEDEVEGSASEEKIEDNTDETTKKYEFFNDSNIKLRDEIKPYVLPVCISALLILVYTAIRYKRLNDGKIHKTLLSLIIESLVLMLTILSVIAIFRVPLEKIMFSILILVELIYLVVKFACMEKKLKEI